MFYYNKYNIDNDGVNFGKISVCPIFNSSAQILRPFVTAYNKKDYLKYVERYGYHCGVDLVPYNESPSLSQSDYSINIYAPAMGVVLSTAEYVISENKNSESVKSVVIQYDANTSFRVGNLTSVCVKSGDLVTQYKVIGSARKWVHFEMLTYNREYPTSQIFTYDKLRLYIANPKPYFTGNYSGLNDGVG